MTLATGSRVGPYQVLAPIGEGGMAALLLALDTSAQTMAVLKVLRFDPSTVAVAIRRRFEREVELLGRLDHPNVVRVLGPILPCPDGLCFPLEFVHGLDLGHYLAREGPQDPATVVAWAGRLGAGLDAIHASGIVHRDLKPANVMRTHDDDLRIIDFGLSLAEDLTRVTRTGVLLGTPIYMAPEQGAGPAAVDRRIDLYAFGLILYLSLTGTLPFPFDCPEKALRAKMSGDLESIATYRPDLGDAWAPWFDRALAPRPEARFASVGEALDALPTG